LIADIDLDDARVGGIEIPTRIVGRTHFDLPLGRPQRSQGRGLGKLARLQVDAHDPRTRRFGEVRLTLGDQADRAPIAPGTESEVSASVEPRSWYSEPNTGAIPFDRPEHRGRSLGRILRRYDEPSAVRAQRPFYLGEGIASVALHGQRRSMALEHHQASDG